MGGGVTETDRCICGMWMLGRACQKGEAAVMARGAATGRLLLKLEDEVAAALILAAAAGAFSRALLVDRAREISLSFSLAFSFSLSFPFSFSFSFFSFFLARLTSSSFSTTLYNGTPFNKLVSTSREGRGSKSPARTLVAVRLRFWEYMVGER